MSAGDVAKRLEVIHGQCIAFNPHTTNELCEDIESHFDTGHGLDDANGNDKHDGKGDAERYHTGCGIRRPGTDACETKPDCNKQSGKIPPLRHLWIHGHESAVYILALTLGTLCS